MIISGLKPLEMEFKNSLGGVYRICEVCGKNRDDYEMLHHCKVCGLDYCDMCDSADEVDKRLICEPRPDRPGAAVADYRKAADPKLDEAANYCNHAVANAYYEHHEKAIANCDKAIGLRPNYAAAYYNRGNAKHALGRHEAAVADYDEAIRLIPAQVRFRFLKAPFTLDYDNPIRYEPNYPEAYNNRGNAKCALGRYEAAIADYNKVIRLTPDDFEVRGIRPDAGDIAAYSNRGEANARLGRVDEAQRDFEAAVVLARKAGDGELEAEAKRAFENLGKEEKFVPAAAAGKADPAASSGKRGGVKAERRRAGRRRQRRVASSGKQGTVKDGESVRCWVCNCAFKPHGPARYICGDAGAPDRQRYVLENQWQAKRNEMGQIVALACEDCATEAAGAPIMPDPHACNPETTIHLMKVYRKLLGINQRAQ